MFESLNIGYDQTLMQNASQISYYPLKNLDGGRLIYKIPDTEKVLFKKILDV
jgi:hypothetical protein